MGFYLYGSVNSTQLHRAIEVALQYLIAGEWALAVHPRCGTLLSFAILVCAGFSVGIDFVLPR
jgi:Domain of unknown function (DUF6391)